MSLAAGDGPGDGGSQALGGGDDSYKDAGLCSAATTTCTTSHDFGPVCAACASLALLSLMLMAARVNVSTVPATSKRQQSGENRQGAAETAGHAGAAAFGTYGRYTSGGRYASGSSCPGMVVHLTTPIASSVGNGGGGGGGYDSSGDAGDGGGSKCSGFRYLYSGNNYIVWAGGRDDCSRSGDGGLGSDGWGGGSYDSQDATICAITYGSTLLTASQFHALAVANVMRDQTLYHGTSNERVIMWEGLSEMLCYLSCLQPTTTMIAMSSPLPDAVLAHLDDVSGNDLDNHTYGSYGVGDQTCSYDHYLYQTYLYRSRLRAAVLPCYACNVSSAITGEQK